MPGQPRKNTHISPKYPTVSLLFAVFGHLSHATWGETGFYRFKYQRAAGPICRWQRYQRLSSARRADYAGVFTTRRRSSNSR